jgi:hypothetical protein
VVRVGFRDPFPHGHIIDTDATSPAWRHSNDVEAFLWFLGIFVLRIYLVSALGFEVLVVEGHTPVLVLWL